MHEDQTQTQAGPPTYDQVASGPGLTICALNRRGQGRQRPQTRYRARMPRHTRKRRGRRKGRRVYGHRWQAESVFSRQKRRLGAALRARQWANQKKEIRLRCLTHNVMLLAKT